MSSNLALLSAVANGLDYANVFVYQLSRLGDNGDVLVTISTSGNSENVVRALRWARKNGLTTIFLTGFDGGRTAEEADINVHVAADNYGVIEDAHQCLMQVLAQYIRLHSMPREKIAETLF